MSTDLPFVSVVIPTHNRLPVLRQCLAALAQQDFPRERIEVIIVADGCTDGTAKALTGASFGSSLRVFTQEASGAAAARNRGAREARGDLLLFLDDDVIASPRLVRAHREAHLKDGDFVAVGPYLLDPSREPNYLVEALSQFWVRTFTRMAEASHEPAYTDLLTGNLSMPSDLFARLGGFNSAFPECGIEDYEFGVRIIEEMIPIVFVSDARARHFETTDLRRSLARSRRGGSSMVILARLHPSILPTTRLARKAPWAQRFAFQYPRVGGWLATRCYETMEIAQRARIRRLWNALYGRLLSYWFWRGVRDEVGTLDAWRRELMALRSAGDQKQNGDGMAGSSL